MGLKVHGIGLSTCTARVLSCLHEKGLEFEFQTVDIMSGAQNHPSHLALNPFGQVPVLQDGDLTLFESRAITRYLCHKYKDIGPDLLRLDSPYEAEIVGVWLEVEAHQFNPPMSGLMYEVLVKPLIGETQSEGIITTQSEKLGKVLDVYEERLSKYKYLAGDHFTLVDLHHLPYIQYLMPSDYFILFTSRPHVKAWWEDVSSRPSWKKVSGDLKI